MKRLLQYSPLLLLFVLCSVYGFAQADTVKQTSERPLLDKYYPRPKMDTVAKNPVIKSKGVEQKNVLATPKITPQPIEEKRLTFPSPIKRPEIVAAPVKKDSVITVIETPVVTAVSNGVVISDSKLALPQPVAGKIENPILARATATPPPAKKSASSAEPVYKRNRLGSSSPLYNTYEKNSNGAGSVTTMPKR